VGVVVDKAAVKLSNDLRKLRFIKKNINASFIKSIMMATNKYKKRIASEAAGVEFIAENGDGAGCG
jgi:hypothetical protein